MLNLIFADILSFMNSGFLQELVTTGTAGGMEITPAFLLIAAIVTEIPIMMILLAHVLKHQINRWVNIIGYAWGGVTLQSAPPTPSRTREKSKEYGTPDVFQLRDIPEPVPKAGEVLRARLNLA
ncbi:MAG: hypothetical protein IPK17_34555 [Chloroflexi bacterium]|nr:hypothetical protein [Chloroflexota bacterium]